MVATVSRGGFMIANLAAAEDATINPGLKIDLVCA